MKVLLLDTNVVSILFKTDHSLRESCLQAVAGRQLMISFTTRAELMLWPVANRWGDPRRTALAQHIALYTTLYPDEHSCAIWAEIVAQCRRAGRPIQTADAWIASAARQWGVPLPQTFGTMPRSRIWTSCRFHNRATLLDQRSFVRRKPLEPSVEDMDRTGEEFGKAPNQLGREVGVKKKLQRDRRSRPT